jgi:outer membrane lipoprotein-sorting protein
MTNIRQLLVCLTFTTGVALAQTQPSHLDTVLHQMDVASAKFQSAQADFKWELYERVVKQTTTQTGSIYFLKKGSATQMGAKILPPTAKTYDYKNGLLRIYDPGTKEVTKVSSQGKEAQVQSFLTLGSGGSGSDLAKNWTIKDQGTETIDGVSTAKLDLTPKDQSVANMFTHITIWVDTSRDISLRQKFFTPSEDTKTVFNSNIRYNQKVDLKPFDFK